MPTFAENLILLIKKTDGSRKKTAHLLDISEGYLSQLVSGERNASRRMERDVDSALSGNAPKADFLRKIPVVSWTTAGKAASFEDLSNQIDEMVDSTTKDPNAFALVVIGDSMEPLAYGGDRVVLEPNREACNGDMAYVRFTDAAGGGGTLKWFYRTGARNENVKLVPENEKYEPEEIPGQNILFAYPVKNLHREIQKRRKP